MLIFEINRHGARTPWLDKPEYLEGFPVGREMLTPIGMRQRSLLGRLSHYRFGGYLTGGKQLRLLQEEFDE
jgi:hypothetical protein